MLRSRRWRFEFVMMLLRVANWFAYTLVLFSIASTSEFNAGVSMGSGIGVAATVAVVSSWLRLLLTSRWQLRCATAHTRSLFVCVCVCEAASCKYFCIASTIRTHLEAMATPNVVPSHLPFCPLRHPCSLSFSQAAALPAISNTTHMLLRF